MRTCGGRRGDNRGVPYLRPASLRRVLLRVGFALFRFGFALFSFGFALFRFAFGVFGPRLLKLGLLMLRWCGRVFGPRWCGRVFVLRWCGRVFVLRWCGRVFVLRWCGRVFAFRWCGRVWYFKVLMLRPCWWFGLQHVQRR